MKQNTVKVKERYNWPVTILLIIGIVLVILLPLPYRKMAWKKASLFQA